MDKNKFPFHIGSEWRKWDLHVHTPASFHYDYRGSDGFNKVVETINASDIAVFAVTDYFTVEGYKQLFEQTTKLNKHVFPGIELRLEDAILPSRQGAGEQNVTTTAINLQIIFDDDKSLFPKIEEFISCLEFKDFNNRSNMLTRANIIALGKTVDSALNDDAAYKKGCENIRIPKAKIAELLRNKGLENSAFIILPYEKYGGIDRINPTTDSLIKARLTKLGHIIESSKKEQIDFFLGKTTILPLLDRSRNKNQKFLDYIGKAKPCITGSDSHHHDKIGKFVDDKICWIKADPTFEGLRQIIFEPEIRVYIGEEPPSKLDLSKIIKNITVSNAEGWFEKNLSLGLSQDMVSIIGGKGSGKTALLDMLAYAANKDWKEIDLAQSPSSFLAKVQSKLPKLAIEIEWADGVKDSSDLQKKSAQNGSAQKVIYLSQGFITRLCSPDGSEDLRVQIENVIFQKITASEKSIYRNFQNYRDSRLKKIQVQREAAKTQLDEDIALIKENFSAIREKEAIKKEFADKEKDKKGTEKEIKKISDYLKKVNKSEKFEKYQKLTDDKTKLERKVAVAHEKITDIDAVIESLTSYQTRISGFSKDLNAQLKKIGISVTVSIAINPANVMTLINKKRTTITRAVAKDEKDLADLTKEIANIVKGLNLEKTKEDKLTELNKLDKQLGEQIFLIKEKIKAIAEAEKSIGPNFELLLNNFCDFFKIIKEERQILEELYNPLVKTLKGSSEENERLFSFDVELNFDFAKMSEAINALINHTKSGRYKQESSEKLRMDLAEKFRKYFSEFNWEVSTKASEENYKVVKDFIKDTLALFVEDGAPNKGLNEESILGQLRDGVTIEEFYKKLFDINYYKLLYSISFNQKRLDDLSPGLKGVALLILYLELDEEGLKPIIIDQPEENLDNRFVFSTLVRYFRRAKRKRQVIIATHNANLVINTDSEQVIVANYDKDKAQQAAVICYASGAIENSFEDKTEKMILPSRGIRQQCWDILEGGPDAFKKREEKYNFPINNN